LIDLYENFYWATAWAGVGSTHFDNLLANKDKIKKIVVGIHFYQTHPDFIETFFRLCWCFHQQTMWKSCW